jgi:hypothetical protein
LNRRWLAIIPVGVAVVLVLLWLARATIATRYARSYFEQHGIASTVEIGALGLSGVSGSFALGPADAPDVSADRIELYFDPLRWLPRVVEVRLVKPVIRARLDANGKVTLGSLQDWIDSLSQQQGKSQFVSDDLAVALTGLRVLLATPGGALDMNGDVKLVKNLPVSASLHLQPATIAWQGITATISKGALDFNSSSGHLSLRLSGDARKDGIQTRNADLRIDANGFQVLSDARGFVILASSARLQAAAASLVAGVALTKPMLDMTAQNLMASSTGDLRADLAVTANSDFDPASVAKPLASDPALARVAAANLAHLGLSFAGHADRQNGNARFTLSKSLLVKGAKGAVLTVSSRALPGPGLDLDAALAGGGLPPVRLGLRNFLWKDGGFTTDATLASRFSYAMLRGADVAASGKVSWQAGRYAFMPSSCARITLAAFHPGASDLAKDVRGTFCGAQGQPTFSGEGANWKLAGEARGLSAVLPLANAQLDKGAARLAFEGQGADFHGSANVTAAQVTDRTTPIRFKPLAGTGTVTLAGNVWRGQLAMTDADKNALGDVTFSHAMATGVGTAHIAAPKLVFAIGKLQPESLSPLLAPFRRAEGSAGFAGDIAWTRSAITSSGKLTIESLDFLTPLGKAHAVKTEIAFTSLLPPVTADGQDVTISRIDWTLPFSSVDLRFAFNPTTVKVDAVSTDWAQGHAAVGAFTVNLADPNNITGAADLNSIALGSLVTASNLGSKLKLEGKVSGHIPFKLTPEGFRIEKGRIAADGPGRLSIDRSMWNQGGAVAANAVQDFAYQALENLAYDQMSADLNSIAGGRLQILFHIKGRSDPPKPQVAEIAIADILNGTALQKQVPLPSGTPIDLTLDTSLNFDELLKSYAQAWSKSLSPQGQADTAAGAKP